MGKIFTQLLLASLFMLAAPVTRAANMFLDFPDTDISGESVEPFHEGEIDVLSWSWGLSTEANRKTTEIVAEDMSVTKQMDSSTSALVMAALLGQNLGRAVLTVRPPTPEGTKPAEDYLVLTMNNVFVASFKTGGTGTDERLTETIGLSFDSITGVYFPKTGSGKGAPIDLSWDIVQNKKQ